MEHQIGHHKLVSNKRQWNNYCPRRGFAPARGGIIEPPRRYSKKEKCIQYTRKNLDSESFSPQRISGIAVIQPAKDLWDCPQARKGSPGLPWCLSLSDSLRLQSRRHLSFAIDHAKWNIGFLSASVLICGRNTLRTPASQAISRLAVEWC